MDKQSTLYQLMGMRMNGVINEITEQDEDYQALLQAIDEYSTGWRPCISRRRP